MIGVAGSWGNKRGKQMGIGLWILSRERIHDPNLAQSNQLEILWDWVGVDIMKGHYFWKPLQSTKPEGRAPTEAQTFAPQSSQLSLKQILKNHSCSRFRVLFFLNLIFILYWSIVDLLCCVNFRYSKWFSYMCVCVYILSCSVVSNSLQPHAL